MKKLIKTTIEKIPGFSVVSNRIRHKIRLKRNRKLLENLHPLATNAELIRLGPEGDGGYLVPNDLEKIETCFSPGISFVSRFELECAQKGMNVFLADGSVDGPAEEHEKFHFTKKFIGETPSEHFITLDDWINSSIGNGNTDLMMQIDIEGYEYEVFRSTSDALMRRFRIIVAEFHDLDSLVNTWKKSKEINHVFDKILQTHSCVHIHPNNDSPTVQKDGFEVPPVMEFTFLRKDRINHSSFQTSFPHPLDHDNTQKAPLVLPKCWYSKHN